MAKKKKRKTNRTRMKAEREDYRNGGRVSLQDGGIPQDFFRNRPSPSPSPTPSPSDEPLVDPTEREKRIEATAELIQEGALGKVPEAAVIPEAEKVKEAITQRKTTMAAPTAVAATKAKPVADEKVTTAKAVKAAAPEEMEAAKMKAAEAAPAAKQ